MSNGGSSLHRFNDSWVRHRLFHSRLGIAAVRIGFVRDPGMDFRIFGPNPDVDFNPDDSSIRPVST
jgi:hypothetical protein